MSDAKCEEIIIIKDNHDIDEKTNEETKNGNNELIKSLCCDDEKLFNNLEEYVLSNDDKEIAKKINSLFKGDMKINDDEDNEILYLSVLNVFRKIKKLNLSTDEYMTDMKKSKTNEPEYDIKQLDKIKTLNDFKSSQVLTERGVELSYYRYILDTAYIVKRTDRIRIDRNNYKEKIHGIVEEINKFNPLIETIIEDNEWRINLKDTMNFCVPKNRVVISNSIQTHDTDHPLLTSHLEKILRHIENIYDVSEIEYQITEDNKYSMSWIFIIIRPHSNSSKGKNEKK